MKLLNGLFNQLMKWRMRQVRYMMQHPHQVQERWFRELVRAGSFTEWGSRYGYTSIRRPEEFRERVPVSDYEALVPWIERLMKGEERLLWPTPIRNFSKSSGTTNARSKFIPVSKESLHGCHFKAGTDMIAIYISRNPHSRLFSGKTLAIGGSYQPNPEKSGSFYGDVSAIVMKNLPSWAEYMRAPSLEVALMNEWEAKIERMAQLTARENMTSIAGVPTWTVVLLQRILEITGKSDIREVWPNLEVFAHGAVAFGPYRDTFRHLIPHGDMRYLELYNASEGFFGIQDTDNPDEMLLLLDHGVYYEFIPAHEWEREHPKAIGLEEVELGKNYALVISTNGGLWRYKIGDTIRFTELNPYRFKITGRTRHFINAFGEEVMVENAEEAIVAACKATGARISNFTAAPIYLGVGQKGGHEWVIEFESQPADLGHFTHVLDSRLREVNSDYDAKRYQDIALVAPLVRVVPKGTFYNWMKTRGKLGGQHKVPRLSNTREYVDDLNRLIQMEA